MRICSESVLTSRAEACQEKKRKKEESDGILFDSGHHLQPRGQVYISVSTFRKNCFSLTRQGARHPFHFNASWALGRRWVAVNLRQAEDEKDPSHFILLGQLYNLVGRVKLNASKLIQIVAPTSGGVKSTLSGATVY